MVKKQFYVVAYDVSDDKRRAKVVKVLLKYGKRINLSVFECMLSDSQFRNLKEAIMKVSDRKNDHILVYPICLNCFAKIESLAGGLSETWDKVVVV